VTDAGSGLVSTRGSGCSTLFLVHRTHACVSTRTPVPSALNNHDLFTSLTDQPSLVPNVVAVCFFETKHVSQKPKNIPIFRHQRPNPVRGARTQELHPENKGYSVLLYRSGNRAAVLFLGPAVFTQSPGEGFAE
jgi:hypothetical protein